MIVTKIRLQEQNPMASGAVSWPLPSCDLILKSSAGENGYLVRSVTGLGPPPLVSQVVGFDITGIPILESAPVGRDIGLRIGFSPGLGQSVSSLRDELYKYVSRLVVISLMNDATVVAQTTGFIREFEATHFSTQPEVQIIIECSTGDFKSPLAVPIPFSDLDATPVVHYDNGTAPTGMDLTFSVTAAHVGFSISGHAKNWHSGSTSPSNLFNIPTSFLVGDSVTISTGPKDKRLTMIRASVLYDLAGNLNAGAVWPRLYSGVNAFDWTLSSSWMSWTSASYIPRFWGV